jgi:hypothetical protein
MFKRTQFRWEIRQTICTKKTLNKTYLKSTTDICTSNQENAIL